MLQDLRSSFKLWRVWAYLPYEEMRSEYRHTVLGPYWSLINTALFIVPVCLLYKNIFHQDKNYYLYVLTGLVIWGFISTSIMRGLSAIIAHGIYFKEIKLPFSLFLLKVLVKNSINFLHQVLFFFLYLLVFHKGFSLVCFLAFAGILLLIMTLFFWCLAGAILVLYFRDLPQVVAKALHFLFLSTPIIWHHQVMNQKYHLIWQLNPMTALVNIVREPLLGVIPSTHDVFLVLMTALLGCLISSVIYLITKNKIIFLV